MEEAERIKALVFLGGLGFGGSEIQLARLAPLFDKSLFDVQVAYCAASLAGRAKIMLEQAGIKVTLIDRMRLGRVRSFLESVAFMRQEGIDIVHAWLASANYFARLPAIAAGVPVTIGGLRGKRGLGGLWPLVYAMTDARCAGWVVNSRNMRDTAKRKFKFIIRSPIFYVPNGLYVGTDGLFQEEKTTLFDRLKLDRPVVGIVGRFHPIKNHLLFIQMARRLTELGTDADYWLVGDGEMRSQIEKAIAQYDLQCRVKLLGMRHDVDVALSRMDIFVLTSNSESCPNVLLEAMRASLPVISTRCTSLEEIIEDGVNGYTVPVGDVEGLAARVRTILADAETRRRLGESSQRIVEQRFSMSVAIKLMQQVYIDALRRASKRKLRLKAKLKNLGLL